MPPSKDSKAKVVDKSLIRHYVNSLSKSEWDKQKERYEEEEPLADSKSWKEFLRLAISREELEGRSADAKAIIREGNQVVSKTQLKPNSLMGFGKRTNPELDLALANLERRAQRWSERRHGHGDARDRGHSHGHEPERRRSHHDRHPRMPAIHEEEVRPNASQGRGYGPAPPQGYVYPPRPPIRPPPDQQSLRGTTMIGSGYSSYLPDSNNQGSYAARSGRDSMADGGSRVGSQGRVSGAGSGSNSRLPNWGGGGDESRSQTSTRVSGSGLGSESHGHLLDRGSGGGDSRSRTSTRVSGGGHGSGSNIRLPNWGFGGGSSTSRTSTRLPGSGH